MISNWNYNSIGGRRDFVKSYIQEKKYKVIDVGASAMYWSYPECKFVADSLVISKEGTTFFNINLENKNTWNELLEYVEKNGKFDFSICSHTLEDVFNPLELINLLNTISVSGFVAIPSKYDEFSFLYQNNYRGNAHHKQFFDVVNDMLVVYPKFSWTERDNRSDEILKHNKGNELSFFWENDIPIKIFGDGVPYKSYGELMNNFYLEITK
jgi:hypothetical protein